MIADETLTEFVEATERKLGEAVAEDDLNPTTCREAGNAAFAMLALGRVDQAKEWFAAAAARQTDVAVRRKAAKLERVETNGAQLRVGDIMWSDFHNLAVLGAPSGDETVQFQIGETLYEHATDPALDELDGWDRTPRPYAIAGFGALYIGRDDVGEYCHEAHARAAQKGRASDTFYRTLVTAIDRIATGDKREIEAGVEAYLRDYHTEHVVGNDDGFHVAIQRVSREATTLLALARTRGVDVRVESEYVPDAIYDDYYPLGGR